MAEEESQGDLPGGGATELPNFGQEPPAGGIGHGKVTGAEGAIGYDGDPVGVAPGDKDMLDRALADVIEDLVAGDLAHARDRLRIDVTRPEYLAHIAAGDKWRSAAYRE